MERDHETATINFYKKALTAKTEEFKEIDKMLEVFHSLDAKALKEKCKGNDCKKLVLAFKSNVFGGSVLNPVCV